MAGSSQTSLIVEKMRGADASADTEQPTESDSSCPRGVSQQMWEKFQKLKSRRQQVTRSSTNKRISKLQNDIMLKVQEEMTSEEELKSLRDNNVKLSDEPRTKKAKTDDSAELNSLDDRPGTSQSVDISKKAASTSQWKDIQEYLGCNDHLKGLDKGKYAPKSKLEEELDMAVERKDLTTAERVSDQLAAREFGTKIVEAIDAKKYAEQKKKEDEIAKQKRKKKLAWGFAEKHRWETKSNM